MITVRGDAGRGRGFGLDSYGHVLAATGDRLPLGGATRDLVAVGGGDGRGTPAGQRGSGRLSFWL